MGTSVSQRSPRSGRTGVNWSAVSVAYRSDNIPIERVVKEVWRAAQSDAESSWANLLQASAVLGCRDISIESGSAQEAMSAAVQMIARDGSSSIAADIAKRAIVQSFGSESREIGFAESLFAEATNYLVSRDLAGLVGTSDRTGSVTSASEFKRQIVQSVRDQVNTLVQGGVAPARQDMAAWRGFVRETIESLSSTSQ